MNHVQLMTQNSLLITININWAICGIHDLWRKSIHAVIPISCIPCCYKYHSQLIQSKSETIFLSFTKVSQNNSDPYLEAMLRSTTYHRLGQNPFSHKTIHLWRSKEWQMSWELRIIWNNALSMAATEANHDWKKNRWKFESNHRLYLINVSNHIFQKQPTDCSCPDKDWRLWNGNKSFTLLVQQPAYISCVIFYKPAKDVLW